MRSNKSNRRVEPATRVLLGAWFVVCADAAASVSLENTYWKLISVRGERIEIRREQREPHMILQSEQHGIAGSDGCNMLTGNYVLDGQRIAFSDMRKTLKLCLADTILEREQERAFFQAFDHVAAWRIRGEELDLVDQSGGVLANFCPMIHGTWMPPTRTPAT